LSTKAIKKPRPSLDIDTLSDKQRRIIAEAAAILDVPFDDLPDAISTLGTSSGRPPSTHRRPRQRFSSNMGVSRGNKKPPSSFPRSGSSSDSWEKSVEESHPATNLPDAKSHFCGLDSIFGFEKNTSIWADCLGSLAPPEPNLGHSHVYSMYEPFLGL
jgi:hypothetical protein